MTAEKKLTVVGAGPDEWVWAAIAAGDVTAVRAAPPTFDISGVHPKYGGVFTLDRKSKNKIV